MNKQSFARMLNGFSGASVQTVGVNASRPKSVRRRPWLGVLLLTLAGIGFAAITVPKPVLVLPEYSQGTYTLTWGDGGTPEERFDVWEKVGNGNWTLIENDTLLGSRTFTPTAQGSYSYKALQCNWFDSGENGNPDDPVCSTVSDVKTVGLYWAPGMPSMSGSDSTDLDGTYTVSWTQPSGTITKYELWQKKNSGSWTLVSRSAANDLVKNHTFTTVADASYKYKARACNLAGCGSYSGERAVTVLKTPTVPVGLSLPANNTNGAFTLSWDASSETVDRYEVVRVSHVPGSQYELVATTTATPSIPAATSYTPANHPDGGFNFRVRACNGVSNCSNVSALKAINVLKVPTMPQNVALPDGPSYSGDFTLSWDASAETVDHYQIDRAKEGENCPTNPSVQFCNLGQVTGTSKSFVDHEDGNFSYKVKACNASGCSARTESVGMNVAKSVVGLENAERVTLARPVGATIGSLSEQGSIDGGEANYGVSIPVPPGRRGMAPTVSLNYSSGAGAGIAGMGWSLSAGQDSIYRCATVEAIDGATHPYSGSNNDRLCWGGQQLRVIDGSYGQPGSKYHTEVHSFAVVQLLGASSSTAASRFKVTAKSGVVSYYNEAVLPPRAGGQESYPTHWLLTRVEDLNGNQIDYQYTGSSTERLLDRIIYTGKDGTQGNRSVVLTYEASPVKSVTYSHQGMQNATTQRLKVISTYVANTPVHSVNVRYDTSDATGRSLLAGLQLCKSGTSTCYPESRYNYSEQGLAFAAPMTLADGEFKTLQQLGDIDGDGTADTLLLEEDEDTGELTPLELRLSSEPEALPVNGWMNASLKTALGFGGPFKSQRRFTHDFNSDGKDDLYRVINGRLEVGSWNASEHDIDMFEVDLQLGTNFIESVQDVDRDGDVDIIAGQYIHFNCSAERVESLQFCSSYRLPDAPSGSGGVKDRTDLNGDLLPDWRYDGTNAYTGDALTAYVRFGQIVNGTFSLSDAISLEDLGGPSSFMESPTFMLDVNGDGLVDIFNQHPDGNNTLWLNTGSRPNNNEGMFVATAVSGSINIHSKLSGGMMPLDYDHDGRSELLVPTEVVHNYCYEWLAPTWELQVVCSDISDGSGEVAFTSHQISGSNRGIYRYDRVQFLQQADGTFTLQRTATPVEATIFSSGACDANGDGLTDVCYEAQNATASQVSGPGEFPQRRVVGTYGNLPLGSFAQLNQRAPDALGIDVLTQATNGIGMVNTWAYGALSGTGHPMCNYSADAPFYRVEPELAFEGQYHFNSSMHVVTRHGTSNGVGGMNAECFRFENAMFSTGGRGFQGFKAIIVDEDLEDGDDTSTRTEYYDYFPLTGKPVLVEKRLRSESPSVNPLASSVYDWHSLKNIDRGVHYVYLAEKSDETYNFDSPAREKLTETTLINYPTPDDRIYGNVSLQRLTTTTLNAAGQELVVNQTYTDLVYDYSEVDSGWLDKLDKKTVTTSGTEYSSLLGPQPDAASNSAKIVTEDYEYHWGSKRHLETRTVQAGVEYQEYSETYSYDDYGNVTAVVADTPSKPERETQVSFAETQGYFPYLTTDAVGFETVVVHSAEHGQVTDTLRADGTAATLDYDFGGQLQRTHATPGTARDIITQWCTGCGSAVLKKFTVQDGMPETVEYVDVLGRTIKTEVSGFGTAPNTLTAKVFDERGRVLTESQPGHNELTYPTHYQNYDALGRYGRKVVDRTGHAHASQVWEYQYQGLTTNITLPGGGLSASRTYDASNQLLSTTDTMDSTTHHRYDGRGKLILTENAVGTQVRHYFDDLGRKVRTEDPDAGTSSAAAGTMLYDGYGDLMETVNAKGESIVSQYDQLGRVTLRLLDGRKIGDWDYGAGSQAHLLMLVESGDANRNDTADYSKRFYYDAFARPIGTDVAIEGSPRLLESRVAYDAYYNRPKGRKYPSGEIIGYDYDRHGILFSARSAWTGPVDANGSRPHVTLHMIDEMNARGQTTKLLYGNAVEGTLDYADSTGDVRDIEYGDGSVTPLAKLKYRYDDAFGNLSARESTVPGVVESFEYDDLQRLSLSTKQWSSASIPTYSVDYDYDAVGNLTKKDDFGQVYHYGNVTRDAGGNAGPHAVHQVDRPGNGGVIDDFEYDDAGNMTAGNGRTVEYDVFNKPTRIQQGANVTTLLYAPDLSLVARTDGANTTFYDDGYQMVKVGAVVSEERTFAATHAVIVKSQQGRKLRYQHFDRLGSLVLVTDDLGAVVEKHGFDAFGKPLEGDWQDTGGLLHSGGTGPEQLAEQGFNGHEHLDQHKLVHMGGRIYDPMLGRFMSVDPFIQSQTSTQSQNAYTYVMNNPLSHVDPSGYRSVCPNEGSCYDTSTEYGQSKVTEALAIMAQQKNGQQGIGDASPSTQHANGAGPGQQPETRQAASSQSTGNVGFVRSGENATAEDVEKARAMWIAARNGDTPVGHMLRDMENSEHQTTVLVNADGKDNSRVADEHPESAASDGTGVATVINFDPRDGGRFYRGKDDSFDVKRLPEGIIVHEATHAWRMLNGTYSNRMASEMEATLVENWYRVNVLKADQRTTYSGWFDIPDLSTGPVIAPILWFTPGGYMAADMSNVK